MRTLVVIQSVKDEMKNYNDDLLREHKAKSKKANNKKNNDVLGEFLLYTFIAGLLFMAVTLFIKMLSG